MRDIISKNDTVRIKRHCRVVCDIDWQTDYTAVSVTEISSASLASAEATVSWLTVRFVGHGEVSCGR